jgi:ribosomal protein S1
LSKKGEWQLNSGDSLKGTKVIDQQVDKKKIRVSLSISQLLPSPLFN